MGPCPTLDQKAHEKLDAKYENSKHYDFRYTGVEKRSAYLERHVSTGNIVNQQSTRLQTTGRTSVQTVIYGNA